MPSCLVIADDLTGANATGVLLHKNGLDAITTLDPSPEAARNFSQCDCLITSTDSRGLPEKDAYDRVLDALKLFAGQEVQLYSKRIDSTLRGNIGAELNAFLDFLGPDYLAVCAPSFPASGRILIGSHLLVNNIPLSRTEAALDPLCPVNISNAQNVIQQQSQCPVVTVGHDYVQAGAEHLARALNNLVDARIVLIDAVSDQDLSTVADALVSLRKKIICVDPGPFTAMVARKLLTKTKNKVLCSIGSVNGVAATQVKKVLDNMPVDVVYMDIASILESDESCAAEIERISNVLLASDSDLLAVIGCGLDPSKRVPFEPYMEKRGMSAVQLSELINNAFAQVTLHVLGKNKEISGLYSSGGDITRAIHALAGSQGLRLLAHGNQFCPMTSKI